MYRPEGWEKTLREILDSFNVTYMNSDECKLIEAGADAMLKGLRRRGVRELVSYKMGTSCSTSIPITEGGSTGTVVFIPDDKEEE